MKPEKYEVVESKYSDNWSGIVLRRVPRKTGNDLCLVLIIIGTNGEQMKERVAKIIGAEHLQPVNPIEAVIVAAIAPNKWIFTSSSEAAEMDGHVRGFDRVPVGTRIFRFFKNLFQW